MNLTTQANLTLFEAERAYLIALGWVERPYKLFRGETVIRWEAPNGDEMDHWAAVQQAKLRSDYDVVTWPESAEKTRRLAG